MIPERASISDGAARSLSDVLGPGWCAHRNGPETQRHTYPVIQRPGPGPQVAINGAAGGREVFRASLATRSNR